METLAYQIESFITQRSQIISGKIVERQYSLQPEFWKAYGSRGRNLSVRDAAYHLPFLTEAVLADDPKIFRDYVAWVKLLFRGLKFPDEVMITTLECTDAVLQAEIPADLAELVSVFIREGLEQMQQPSEPDQSYIDENTPIGKTAKQYISYLLNGDRNSASLLILSEVEKGTPIRDI